MKIAVIGAGAIGCWFSTLLARAGHEVTLVARGAQLEALSQRALRVQSVLLGELEVPLHAVGAEPAQARPVDAVIVAVKTQHIRDALPVISAWAGTSTPVVSTQNGVDAPAELRAHLGAAYPVWPGCVYVLVNVPRPGVLVQSASPNRFLFGDPHGRSDDRMQKLADVLTAAGIATEVTPRITSMLWEKFSIISGWNGVISVTRQPIGVVLADPVTRRFLEDTIAEAHAVGRAHSVELAADLGAKQMAFIEKFAPDSMGSMALDLLAGRPLELEALNGAVVRLGREVGVATPMNTAIHAALRPYVDGARPLPGSPP